MPGMYGCVLSQIVLTVIFMREFLLTSPLYDVTSSRLQEHDLHFLFSSGP